MSKELKVLKPFKLGLKRYAVGDVIEADAAALDRLQKRGFIGSADTVGAEEAVVKAANPSADEKGEKPEGKKKRSARSA